MKKIVFILFSVLFLFGIAACKHDHSHEEEHDHSDCHHHDAALQLVSYGTHFEIYAEATPFSVGEESELLTHVTKLSDFKPLSDGKVVAKLSVGGKSVSVSASVSETNGIFHLHLTPTVAGEGSLTFYVQTDSLKDTLCIQPIKVFADEHEAAHDAEEHQISSASAIQFTKEKSWQVDFATDYPHVQSFGQVIPVVAQVQPAVGDEATIVAKANGILTFSSSSMVEGASVTKGTTVATIAFDGLLDDNLTLRLAEAKNNYETAKQNYERAKGLVDNKIVSQQEFLALKAAYENAKLVYENLRNGTNGSRVSVTTPLGGYIKQILVQNGSYVSVGQPIMVVSQNHNLILKAEVPLRFANVLSSVTDATIENPSTHEVSTLSELGGSVLSRGSVVSADNFMLPVSLEINKLSGYTPGAFTKVWLQAFGSNQALVIPKKALIEEQGNYYVFVQLTPEQFEKKQVTIGATDGISVEVLSGLTTTQRIVTKGAVLVKLAKSSGALDPHAGHIH